MPPRYVYWTIIYGNAATSFRAGTREELLPTLKQLQSRHPDAVMKFFARGKLWDSEEEARQWRDERQRRDRPPDEQRRPAEHRGKDWRPGGKHRDPRDRFKVPRDVKRKRFADRLRRDRVSPKPAKPGGGSTASSGRPPQDRWRRERPTFPPRPDRVDRSNPTGDPDRASRRPQGRNPRGRGRR
jgi:hypothetical protein